ncbi:hypothetical protein Hanom_Chr15g01398421 [Helianthus anomalus]
MLRDAPLEVWAMTKTPIMGDIISGACRAYFCTKISWRIFGRTQIFIHWSWRALVFSWLAEALLTHSSWKAHFLGMITLIEGDSRQSHNIKRGGLFYVSV